MMLLLHFIRDERGSTTLEFGLFGLLVAFGILTGAREMQPPN